MPNARLCSDSAGAGIFRYVLGELGTPLQTRLGDYHIHLTINGTASKGAKLPLLTKFALALVSPCGCGSPIKARGCLAVNYLP